MKEKSTIKHSADANGYRRLSTGLIDAALSLSQILDSIQRGEHTLLVDYRMAVELIARAQNKAKEAADELSWIATEIEWEERYG